jgi:molecular chaperone DnaK (HSP70)
MAASDTQDAKRKQRKQNFSVSEIAVLTEKVEENISIIQSKFTNAVTNKRKNLIWDVITASVNSVGVDNRTVQEVKDKWKNLQSTAKKVFSGFRKQTKKTGGGPAPKPPSAATTKIIDMFKETPSFTGLQGFETGT